MEASINSHPLLSAEIVEPRDAAWTARVELDADEAELSGQVTLSSGGETWRGFVERGRVESGRWLGELVGGRGGLEKAVPAQYYVGSTYAALVADILSACGEQLDPAEHQAAALAGTAERWQRIAGTARAALNAVAKATGTTWRITREGGVAFVAAETWAKLEHEYDELRGDPSAGAMVTAPASALAARPGRSLGDARAYEVRTLIGPGGARQVVMTSEAAGSTEAILAEAMRSAARDAAAYSQIYPAKVIAQDTDGTVHLMPDDYRVRGSGLTKVPLRHGVPGLTVKVRPGERAALFFEDGDPQKPACGLWPDGSSVLEVTLTADAKLTLTAAQTALGATPNPTQSFVRGEAWVQYFDAFVQALTSALSAITPGPATGGGAPAVAALNASLAALAPLKAQLLSLTIKGE